MVCDQHNSSCIQQADLFDRNDARAVSIMSMGCLHPVMKVQKLSMHFFLGHVEDQKDSDDENKEVCSFF